MEANRRGETPRSRPVDLTICQIAVPLDLGFEVSAAMKVSVSISVVLRNVGAYLRYDPGGRHRRTAERERPADDAGDTVFKWTNSLSSVCRPGISEHSRFGVLQSATQLHKRH